MTIAQVCKKYDITADTLRYYEKIGMLPKVTRTAGGIRNYTDYECGWIEFIKCMRSTGVSIESLTEYVRLFEYGDKTAERRKQILIDERDRILEKIRELQAMADRLNMKIAGYEKIIQPAEYALKVKD